MKTVDIDKLLEEEGMEFVINGKKFVVKDVSDSMSDSMEAGMKPREFVKAVLGATDEDLAGYGLLAMAKIVEQISTNFLQGVSIKQE